MPYTATLEVFPQYLSILESTVYDLNSSGADCTMIDDGRGRCGVKVTASKQADLEGPLRELNHMLYNEVGTNFYLSFDVGCESFDERMG
jgi:hypothetical protein